MKKFLTCLVLLFFACVLIACGDNSDTTTPSATQPTTVSVSSVRITGGRAIQVNETVQLTATVLPANADQNVIWSSSNTSVATVSETGLVRGISNGSVVITATSATSTRNGKCQIAVGTVSDETYPDLGGYTIRIAYDNNRTSEIDPRHDDYLDSDNDKEIRTKAFEKVEELYNCTIEIAGYPNITSDMAKWDYILQQGANNTADFDFYWVPTAKIAEFSTILLDLKDYYAKWGHNYLSDADYLAKMYKDAMYGAGRSTNRPTANDCLMVFNANLLDSISVLEPGTMFLNDDWTLSDFRNWVIDAQAKLDTKGASDGKQYYVLSGALNYYVYSIARTCGVALASTTAGALQVTHQAVINAAELMHDLLELGCVDPDNLTDEKTTSWNEGRALMCIGSSYFVNYANRWPSNLWGAGETVYGFAPFPYADNMHYTDAKYASYGETAYVMPRARAASYAAYGPDVTAENIYRAYMDLSYWTEVYKEEDATYDQDTVDYTNATSKWGTEASVEAWLYFVRNLNELSIFDPIKEIANMHNSDYARAVAAYISPAWGARNGFTTYPSYLDAVTPTIAALQQAFVEKFN